MFFRVHKLRQNGKEYNYLKLVENYRENGRTRQRVIVNFGRVQNLDKDKLRYLIKDFSIIQNGSIKNKNGNGHSKKNGRKCKSK